MKEVTNLKTKKAHFASALQWNGYPTACVKAASIEMTPRECGRNKEQGEGKPTWTMVLYSAGISERIRKVYKELQHHSDN